ncbi:SDR family oxidoreductase [Streptomyces sioyaensis]|uniref:SDR family oxidoreductase n=1 Tax=Streptomyces sioyaensis TaxID=67364 RepID=UPI0037162AA0
MAGGAVPDLIAAAERGDQADLVNISSDAVHRGFPNFAVYCATKAAVTHLAHTLRTELGPRQVSVTHIEPGLVETELTAHLTHPESYETPDRHHPQHARTCSGGHRGGSSPSRRANQAM